MVKWNWRSNKNRPHILCWAEDPRGSWDGDGFGNEWTVCYFVHAALGENAGFDVYAGDVRSADFIGNAPTPDGAKRIADEHSLNGKVVAPEQIAHTYAESCGRGVWLGNLCAASLRGAHHYPGMATAWYYSRCHPGVLFNLGRPHL